MKFLFLSLLLVSSVSMAKAVYNSESDVLAATDQYNTVMMYNMLGDCLPVSNGTSLMVELLASNWNVDNVGHCAGAVVENEGGHCVQTKNTIETRNYISLGYTVVEKQNCNY